MPAGESDLEGAEERRLGAPPPQDLTDVADRHPQGRRGPLLLDEEDQARVLDRPELSRHPAHLVEGPGSVGTTEARQIVEHLADLADLIVVTNDAEGPDGHARPPPRLVGLLNYRRWQGPRPDPIGVEVPRPTIPGTLD